MQEVIRYFPYVTYPRSVFRLYSLEFGERFSRF